MGRSPPAADSDLGRRGRATRPSTGEGGGGGGKEELARRRHGASGRQWQRHSAGGGEERGREAVASADK
jgi:hypothetical protein